MSNPINAPWGQKGFTGYLQGGIQEAKEQYDATELISKHSDPVHILIDYVRRHYFSSFI
jgi:S-formylglutathione hydrolase